MCEKNTQRVKTVTYQCFYVVWCVYVISFSFLPAKINLRLNGDRIYIRQTIEETTFRTRSVVVRACVQSCWYREEKKNNNSNERHNTEKIGKTVIFCSRIFDFFIYISWPYTVHLSIEPGKWQEHVLCVLLWDNK